MLNPIDLPTVFAADRVHGTSTEPFPGPRVGLIHPGVAWWIGACLILTSKANGVAVVHDGTDLGRRYTDRFCRGAVNCQHYAATVSVLGEGGHELLAYGIRTLRVPGMLISTEGCEVTMRLVNADGAPMTCGTGLELICDLIARDRVPIPVNEAARGRIVDRRDLADHYATAEG